MKVQFQINSPRFILRLTVIITAISFFTSCHAPKDPDFCPKEYSDYFQFNGITYSYFGKAPTNVKFDSEYAVLENKIIGSPCDYVIKDGDASVLDIGTQVYTVENYAPFFRLATKENDELKLYEVSSNLRAKTGGEILDIRDRVQSIDIYYRPDLHKREQQIMIESIKDEPQVETFVNNILESSVDSPKPISTGDPVYLIFFNLYDGTTTQLFYWLDLNSLQFNLQPSSEFHKTMQAIVSDLNE
jgi:hypothetical protein